eukprot:CAMPEP_0194047420 /NCGR_PEP_ID=MMETSP0009_2-20130614/24584_1 /TAXON_ID=210454 /ORGANISM="Grammatophora oceanica, Strain CCMP 410" /LENGTH=50 /DNA_ID=CAMNT_0038693041 /DNA_START=128 /DNA_END=280 /DNA_ORIENTATION=-
MADDDAEQIHHSYFVMLSVGIMLVAGFFGVLQFRMQQASLEADRKAKKSR